MRAKIYATSADRQRAYRARQTNPSIGAEQPARKKPKRPPSKPARLAASIDLLRALQTEYESWLEAMPESLAETHLADRLKETIEQFESALEILEEIEPPRPFERS